MRTYLWSKIIEMAYSIKTLRRMYLDYMHNISEEEFLLKYLDFELHLNEVENISGSINYYNFYKSKKELGFIIVTIYDDIYPEKLRNSISPPIAFYYIGDISLLKEIKIAVVGSRNAPDKYLVMSKNLGKGLSKMGFCGISGLAIGIDASFHIGCSRTLGVLGCGIDIVYPYINRKIFNKLIKKGGLISEYPLGTKPLPYHFPRRNRIIAGAAEILILVYAGAKSGSIITLDYALDLGMDVFLTTEMYERLDLAGYKITQLKKYLNKYLSK